MNPLGLARVRNLVVWSSSPDEDLDLVFPQLVLEPLQGGDDAFEGGGDVSEIGNPACRRDNKNGDINSEVINSESGHK